jgi:hypothetical protein
MSRPEPEINLTKIAFPSDRLTVKMLRERLPQYFDNPARNPRVDSGEWGAMLGFERYVAKLAFDDALGKPVSQTALSAILAWSKRMQIRLITVKA